MAVAVRSRSRVLVEALTGAAAPTDVLRAVRGRGALLLEDGTASGWSYLVPRPRAVLERHDPAGAFAAARALLDRAASDRPADAPPFWGGIAGSFGYDLARGLEDLPAIARDDLALPVLRLHLVDELLAFDHQRGIVLACAPSAAGIRRLAALYEDGAPRRPVVAGGRCPRRPLICRLPTARRARARAHRSRGRVPGEPHAPPVRPLQLGRRALRRAAKDGARPVQPVPRRRVVRARRGQSRDVPAGRSGRLDRDAGRSREPLRARTTPPRTARLRLRSP